MKIKFIQSKNEFNNNNLILYLFFRKKLVL